MLNCLCLAKKIFNCLLDLTMLVFFSSAVVYGHIDEIIIFASCLWVVSLDFALGEKE